MSFKVVYKTVVTSAWCSAHNMTWLVLMFWLTCLLQTSSCWPPAGRSSTAASKFTMPGSQRTRRGTRRRCSERPNRSLTTVRNAHTSGRTGAQTLQTETFPRERASKSSVVRSGSPIAHVRICCHNDGDHVFHLCAGIWLDCECHMATGSSGHIGNISVFTPHVHVSEGTMTSSGSAWKLEVLGSIEGGGVNYNIRQTT